MLRQGPKRIYQGLRSSVQFLTIMPWPGEGAFDARAALPFFPICGLGIGVALVVVDALASQLWPRLIVSLIDVVALAVISGALHLDGLADTADGLYGRREPEKILSIMKDSRVGAMGVVVVVCGLFLKWMGIAHIAAHYKIWLLLVPAYARAAVLFGTRFLPYGRPGGGTAHPFFHPPLKATDFWSVVVLVALSLLISWQSIILNAGFAAVMVTVLWWYRRKMNCITGDMLGALIEIIETGLFLVAAIQWGA
ncbi:MAG: adenosylcobinamide-GDP ribazoletransferase [Desulfobacteraceae bacterium]